MTFMPIAFACHTPMRWPHPLSSRRAAQWRPTCSGHTLSTCAVQQTESR
jgi:hypothetical protein